MIFRESLSFGRWPAGFLDCQPNMGNGIAEDGIVTIPVPSFAYVLFFQMCIHVWNLFNISGSSYKIGRRAPFQFLRKFFNILTEVGPSLFYPSYTCVLSLTSYLNPIISFSSTLASCFIWFLSKFLLKIFLIILPDIFYLENFLLSFNPS